MLIYPSVLQPDAESLFFQLKGLKNKYDYFQIDIADGKFVNNKTISIREIEKKLKEEELNINCEFHLMVEDYKQAILDLINISSIWNIKNIIIHLKALEKGLTAYDIRNLVSESSLGIAINPEEDIKNNFTVINTFPYVLVMSVIPGSQGSPFLPEALDKIKDLRSLGYKGMIGLDGGINDKTIKIIESREYTPDIVFPGSWLSLPKNN